VRLWWIALVGAGCGKLLSFDKVDPGIDAPDPTHFTIDYTQRVYSNDATGIQAVDTLVDPPAFLVRLPDGTAPHVEHTGVGVFEFDAVTDRYEVQLLRGEAYYPSRYQHTAQQLHLVDTLYGRTDAAYPAQMTPVDLSGIGEDPDAVGHHFYATGLFADINLLAMGARRSTIDWYTESGGAGLVSAAAHDRLYYLEYNAPVAGANGLEAYLAFPSIEMVSGAQTTLAGALVHQTTPRTVMVTASLGTEAARLMPTLATPKGATTTNSAIGLLAHFGEAHNAAREVPVYSFLLKSPADVTANPMNLFNPIAGTTTAPALFLAGGRDVYAPGAFNPWTFPTEFAQVGSAYSPGGGTEAQTLASNTVGMVTAVTLDGNSLAIDGKFVSLAPSATRQLAWSVAGGAFDWYQVTLYELTNVGGNTFPIYVDTIQTATNQVTLPADELQPAHMYLIDITGVLDTPLAAQGDFRTVSLTGGFEIYFTASFVPALPTSQ